MKNFSSWGIRVRADFERNYYSLWHNLKTTRLDIGDTADLPEERSEFYDVGLGTKCNAECPFCYVAASHGGEFWPEVSKVWKAWMSTFPEDIIIDPREVKNGNDEVLKELFGRPEKGESMDVIGLRLIVAANVKVGNPLIYTEKPFQIAIGSTMEPTIHPEFTEFLKTVFESKVVPNYTTNGITLAKDDCEELLEATRNFCGGVAVSYGNKTLREYAKKAILRLAKDGECKIMIHHLISDKASVDEFVSLAKEYGKTLHYHVLLPLMVHGRSEEGMKDDGTFQYLAEQVDKEGIDNIALGANFLPYLKKYPDLIKVWEYPSELYSHNVLLKDKGVVITPSSYNLEPIKVISEDDLHRNGKIL